jgi:type IV fimbrial biogenesis protein FimT
MSTQGPGRPSSASRKLDSLQSPPMNPVPTGSRGVHEARTVSQFTDSTLIQRRRPPIAIRRRSAGFNMVELMTVVTIGAILLGLSTASYKYITNSNRVSTEVNGLLGDLMAARSEAIRQSYNVIVCPLPQNGGTSCASSTSWQYGWLVFADVNNNGAYDSGTDVLIRVQQPFTAAGDTFQSDQSVQLIKFNSEGFTVGLPTTKGHITVILHTNPTNNQWTRCLQVGTYGALTTERQGAGDCT